MLENDLITPHASDGRPVDVQKADLSVSQITTADAKLLPEQWTSLFLVAIKKSVFWGQTRIIRMTRDEIRVPRMHTFGSQVWHPAVEMEELALAQRVRPTFAGTTLTSSEIMCQVNFPRYFLSANVEQQRFQATLVAYLGLHSQRDFENLTLNGDTTSANTLLALRDGVIADATSNVYDCAGASLGGDLLDTIELTHPEEWADQAANFSFYTTRGPKHSLWREMGARGTALGDQNTVGEYIVYHGRKVYEVPMMPTNRGVGLNRGAVLFTNPKMFLFGIHENVTMETEYHKGARMWSIIMTARVGQGYEYEPGAITLGDEVALS